MSTNSRLVERLVVVGDPQPRPDDDVITESGGETDAWVRVGPRPDTITKNNGERDRWHASTDPRPGPDTITRADGEVDVWSLRLSVDPEPRPDDTITHSDGESDSWS